MLMGRASREHSCIRKQEDDSRVPSQASSTFLVWGHWYAPEMQQRNYSGRLRLQRSADRQITLQSHVVLSDTVDSVPLHVH